MRTPSAILAAQQQGAVEASLWAALRGLEEKASLLRRMAASAEERQSGILARIYANRASEKQSHAEVMRQLLLESQKMEVQNDESSTAAD